MFDGKKLRALRQERHLTSEELAKAVGKSRGYISQLELGQRQPTQEFATQLANVLKVESTQLFEEVEDQSQVEPPLLARDENIPDREQGVTKNGTTELVLGRSMILGLVRGYLHDAYILLGKEALPPSISLRGTVMPSEEAWSLDCDPMHVMLTVSSEVIEQWENSLVTRRPDVKSQSGSLRSGMTSSTLHWFTPYASFRDQVLYVSSLQQRGKVWIHREDLRVLMQSIET